MLGSLKEKLGFGKKKGEVLGAPIEGEAIELSKVSDCLLYTSSVGLLNENSPHKGGQRK